MPTDTAPLPASHDHTFLGVDHARNERKAWAVIVLCSAMTVIEIGGGALFGSLALVADGLHMSTHALALLIAGLAYAFARRHAADPRFGFGTGKVGDLAGFTSAITLALIALFIGYEAVSRLFQPVHIDFREAIPIAVLGLLVNVASAWLLSGSEAGHDHYHPDDGDDDHHRAHHAAHRDHNLRAAFVHVVGDAAVSVLAILALLSGRYLGWVWMDPAMGMVGATVIAVWAYALVRDTSGILLDMMPDPGLAARMRAVVEANGDRVRDLHLWRLGPGHLGAIVSVVTGQAHDATFYRAQLRTFRAVSHLTIEVTAAPDDAARPAAPVKRDPAR